MHHTPYERTLWTPLALRPIIKGQLDVAPLITHRFSLNEIDKAFEASVHDPGAIKIVIDPNK